MENDTRLSPSRRLRLRLAIDTTYILHQTQTPKARSQKRKSITTPKPKNLPLRINDIDPITHIVTKKKTKKKQINKQTPSFPCLNKIHSSSYLTFLTLPPYKKPKNAKINHPLPSPSPPQYLPYHTIPYLTYKQKPQKINHPLP